MIHAELDEDKGSREGAESPHKPPWVGTSPDADGKMFSPAGKTSSLELVEEDMEDSGMNHPRKIIPHSAKVHGKIRQKKKVSNFLRQLQVVLITSFS